MFARARLAARAASGLAAAAAGLASTAACAVAVPNSQPTGGTFGVDSRSYRDLAADGSGARYLHAMLRVDSLDAVGAPPSPSAAHPHTRLTLSLRQALAFFKPLGLVETRRTDVPAGRFTLVFLATAPGEPELELTWNYDGEDASRMSPSRNFGHLAFAVDDIYATCAAFAAAGVTVLRPPRDGKSEPWPASNPARRRPPLPTQAAVGTPSTPAKTKSVGRSRASLPLPYLSLTVPLAVAFVKSPDGISLELLQKGAPLRPREPWASMKNTGEW